MDFGPFLQAVVMPVFEATGIGPVVAGLAVFIIAWTVFVRITGMRE